MEKGGENLALQMDSVAHFYANLLTQKDSILKKIQNQIHINIAGPFPLMFPGRIRL